MFFAIEANIIFVQTWLYLICNASKLQFKKKSWICIISGHVLYFNENIYMRICGLYGKIPYLKITKIYLAL